MCVMPVHIDTSENLGSGEVRSSQIQIVVNRSFDTFQCLSFSFWFVSVCSLQQLCVSTAPQELIWKETSSIYLGVGTLLPRTALSRIQLVWVMAGATISTTTPLLVIGTAEIAVNRLVCLARRPVGRTDISNARILLVPRWLQPYHLP
jgi:hypothetical protein